MNSIIKHNRTLKNFAKVALTSLLLTTSAPQAFSQEALGKADVERIIRSYLMENPEILLEVQQALEIKQQQNLAQNQKEIIATQKQSIISDPYQIEIGDPNAEITVVEFFDYNCHFCQKALSDMQNLLKNDKNVRFVLKEFPVLGEGSIEATRVSMAFSKIMPEKHADFHIELLALQGQKDGTRAMDLALQMGADEQKIREEMENPKIIETIQGTYGLANSLGISGTPSYIIGNEVVFGAVGLDQLENHIKNITQ